MAATYDFIIVGSGPAGIALASTLAKSPKKPRVLLIEAGSANEDRDARVDGQRWFTFKREDMNWGYKTAPQEDCRGREIDYSRGLGIGGSTSINFSIFTVGASGDYDEWARVTGDEAFDWKNMQRRYKSLESLDPTPPPGVGAKYVAPKPKDHGSDGPLKVGYPKEAETDIVTTLEYFEKAGFPLNPDHNSGNPIGIGLAVNSSNRGLRSTAKDLLASAPNNLTVLTGSPVQRVVLEGKKAVGVESNGKKYLASKEVILSAGSLDTPKILMHSGIGPKAQLDQHRIPVVQDTPAIGQGLRDHLLLPLIHARPEGSVERAAFYQDPSAMASAFEQWKKDGTGPWTKFACAMPTGWFKLPSLVASAEFQALPVSEQEYLNHPTVPHYEIMTHLPIHYIVPGFPVPSMSYMCILVFLYNAQARGVVTLQSADPAVPLRFDPKFLGTPFDRRVAIEALRDADRVVRDPEGYARDTLATVAGPAGDTDEDYLEYWRNNVVSSWHMTGTAKMGKTEAEDVVVDNRFRVFGFEGLRVADMSVVPVLASGHLQAVAYLTGLTCAEKLIAEYGLA